MVKGVAQHASLGADMEDGDAKGCYQYLSHGLAVAVLPVGLRAENRSEAAADCGAGNDAGERTPSANAQHTASYAQTLIMAKVGAVAIRDAALSATALEGALLEVGTARGMGGVANVDKTPDSTAPQ